MKLSGDRCRCTTCGEYFNSTYAFDKHRTGDMIARQCLDPAGMAALGMARNAAGFWISQKMRLKPVFATGAARIGGDRIEGLPEQGSEGSPPVCRDTKVA